MVKKMNITNWIARVTKAKEKLMLERDNLEAMISEMESLKEDTEESIDFMEKAVDALNRLLP